MTPAVALKCAGIRSTCGSASRIAGTALALSAIVAWAIPASPAAAQPATGTRNAASVLNWEKRGARSGRPLIFLPALGFQGSYWSKVCEAFEPSHPVYVVTFAGAPGMASCQSPCLDRLVADVHRLIEQERLERPILVGHLLGGHVALRVAGEYPESVHGVFCIPPLLVRPPLDKRSAAGVKVTEHYMTESPEMWESLLRMEATRAVHDAQLADEIMENLRKADRETYGRVMGELVADPIETWLPKIRVPVLLMVPVTLPRESGNPNEQTLKPSQYASICVDRMRLMYPGMARCDATSLRYARTFPIYEHSPQVISALERYLQRLEDPNTKWGTTVIGATPASPAPTGAGTP
jgi:pimeloyl-ACP methyl ester carboxylesterase